MVTTAPPMTAEELLNLPDDGFRYELIIELDDIVPGWRMPVEDIFE